MNDQIRPAERAADIEPGPMRRDQQRDGEENKQGPAFGLEQTLVADQG